jgi:hypothetical protein
MTFNRLETAQEARSNYMNELMDGYRQKAKALEGRKVDFIKSDHPDRKEIAIMVGAGMFTGAVAGGVIGACAGMALGTPGGPPGMLVGAGIGFGVGFAIGTAIGCAAAKYYVYPEYQKWCETEAGKEFAGKLSILMTEANIAEHLCCSLKHTPVIHGVRDKNGKLYEKSFIEACIRLDGLNPFTREPMTKADLIPDESVSLEANKKFISFLKEKRSETIKSAPELKMGFDKLIKDIRQSFIEIYNEKLKKVEEKCAADKISYEDYLSQRDALGMKYRLE